MTAGKTDNPKTWLGLSPSIWLAILFGVFVLRPLVISPLLDGASDAIAGRPNAVQERLSAE